MRSKKADYHFKIEIKKTFLGTDIRQKKIKLGPHSIGFFFYPFFSPKYLSIFTKKLKFYPSGSYPFFRNLRFLSILSYPFFENLQKVSIWVYPSPYFHRWIKLSHLDFEVMQNSEGASHCLSSQIKQWFFCKEIYKNRFSSRKRLWYRA